MNIVRIREKLGGKESVEIRSVFQQAFSSGADPGIIQSANKKRKLLALLAYSENELVGFKLGYEKSKEVFFSWVGAVLPSAQRRGVARTLLLKQHEFILGLGYREIQTEVNGCNKPMLLLNIQEGFVVKDCIKVKNNERIVQLCKQLPKSQQATAPSASKLAWTSAAAQLRPVSGTLARFVLFKGN